VILKSINDLIKKKSTKLKKLHFYSALQLELEKAEKSLGTEKIKKTRLN
jgi:hypothetical protein